MKKNILVTIGPKSCSLSAIRNISSYTNYFRLNGSHNNLDWHKKIIKRIRLIDSKAIILIDIPGIKSRTNNLKTINIKKKSKVIFSFNTNKESKSNIPLTRALPIINKKITEFSLDDGKFYFDFVQKTNNRIEGISRSSFRLLPKKGINISACVYNESLQEKTYVNFLNKIKNFDFDHIGLSFVQTGNLAKKIKSKYPDKKIVSKVENSDGLKNISSISKASDCIMIDRGDLIAEVGQKKFFNAVTKISNITKKNKKPLIMATENLESMFSRLEPSKSEIMSLGHSISLGTDTFMLSEETAMSPLYLNTIKWLHAYLN